MKKIILSSITVFTLFYSVTAFAETNGSTPTDLPKMILSQDGKQEVRQDGRVEPRPVSNLLASSTERKGGMEEKMDDRKKIASTTNAGDTKENMMENEKRGEKPKGLELQMINLKEKLASSTEKMKDDKREEKIKKIENNNNRFGKMVLRYKQAIDNEENILGRVVSRIDKMKMEGATTTMSEIFVNTAQMHFDEAKDALDKLTTAVSALPSTLTASSTTPITKTILDSLRKSTSSVEVHIKEGHAALVNAVSSLRGKSTAKTATSTEENKHN